MPVFSTSVDIDASPDAVWAVWQDVARWPEWTSSVTEADVLDEANMGLGTRVRFVQPALPPTVWTVIAWELGSRFTWESRRAGVRTFGDHLVVSHQGGCRATATVRHSGLLGFLAAWLYGRLTRRYMEMEAAGLKRRAEAL